MSRLAESLARAGAEVEVLALNPRKHHASAQAPLRVTAVAIDTGRKAGPALRAALTRTPFIVTRFFSAAFERELTDALRRFQPDVVQIESPFMLQYVDAVRAVSRARVVLRSLNVEFRIWEGLASIERNPLRRIAMRTVARSLRRYELRAMRELDAVIPISDADAADFRYLGVTARMHVVPCGVALDDGDRAEGEAGTVGFIGSLDFLPNQDAVRWLLDELWPRVSAEAPVARLVIAGSSPPEWLRQRAAATRGVELMPNVADATAFVRSTRIIVAPLFAGGGMRIKVLEAMALGKPIVATSLGAGGIDVTNGRDIVIEDDTDSFASAVVRLLREPETALRLATAARETVRERYDSDALARRLLGFYQSL